MGVLPHEPSRNSSSFLAVVLLVDAQTISLKHVELAAPVLLEPLFFLSRVGTGVGHDVACRVLTAAGHVRRGLVRGCGVGIVSGCDANWELSLLTRWCLVRSKMIDWYAVGKWLVSPRGNARL